MFTVKRDTYPGLPSSAFYSIAGSTSQKWFLHGAGALAGQPTIRKLPALSLADT